VNCRKKLVGGNETNLKVSCSTLSSACKHKKTCEIISKALSLSFLMMPAKRRRKKNRREKEEIKCSYEKPTFMAFNKDLREENRFVA
jgi:hypothetical protein